MGDLKLQHARKMNEHIMNMDFDTISPGKPIDEASLLAAASTPNAPSMEQLLNVHMTNKQISNKKINDYWNDAADQLPDIKNNTINQPVVESHHIPNLQPTQTNKIIQKYKEIFNDLKNLKNMPQSTFLKKMSACFLTNGRAYLSITTFVAFCIIIVIIILLCMGRRRH